MGCFSNKTKEKTEKSRLDYKFDWKSLTNGSGALDDWLADGETIQDYTITAPVGITLSSDYKSDNDTSVTVWFSGGTVPNFYTVECFIKTNFEREEVSELIISMIPPQ